MGGKEKERKRETRRLAAMVTVERQTPCSTEGRCEFTCMQQPSEK